MTETIHILGTGSIAMLWASQLSLAGKPVQLIPRLPETVREGVIQLDSLEAEKPKTLVNICVGDVNNNTFISTLLVCTKAYDAVSACQQLAAHFTAKTRIVLLQNGMGFQSDILNTFSKQHIFIGVSTEGALKHDDRHVSHTGIGKTYIGPASQQKAPCNFSWLKKLECNLNIEPTENITPLQWQKLAVNSVINPLTVYYDCNNGGLLELKAAKTEITVAIEELQHLAAAIGISHVFSDIETSIYDVIRKTAANSSSMREDIRHHRPTEIDFISGFIIQQAQKYKLDMPTHKKLYEYIQQCSQQSNRQ